MAYSSLLGEHKFNHLVEQKGALKEVNMGEGETITCIYSNAEHDNASQKKSVEFHNQCNKPDGPIE